MTKKLPTGRFTDMLMSRKDELFVGYAHLEEPPYDLADRFTELIKRGLRLHRAAARLGVSQGTLEKWFNNALDGNAQCAQFFQRLVEAEIDLESELIDFHLHGSRQTSTAAKTILTRRFPEEWGQEDDEGEQKGKGQQAVVNNSVIYMPEQKPLPVAVTAIDLDDE